MLRNYLKIAFRNLLRHRVFSFINIIGLAVGLACCLLILLFVRDELSYDRQHRQADRIYRIADHFSVNGKEINTAMTPAAWGSELKATFPEIREMTRLFNTSSRLVRYQDRKFTEERLCYADSGFFNLFTYPFLSGNPRTALNAPYAVVITQSVARKYFGESEALGKTLRIDSDTTEYQVTGVMAEVPDNSHYKPDIVASLVTLHAPFLSSWTLHYSLYTYLLLAEDSSPASLEAKLPGFFRQHLPPDVAARYHPELQPLKSIHLHSDLLAEMAPNGSITYVYLFSTIAFFILLIACINYLNLATARAVQRAKEVGVRKVLGAKRRQLMAQFLLESLLMSAFAVLVALVLAHFTLPVLNQLADKHLIIDYRHDYIGWLGLVSIGLLVGVGAGLYPGWFVSGFEPIRVLKGRFVTSAAGTLVRNALVVFQFTISTTLIIATLVVTGQLTYFQQKKAGFRKEQIVTIPLNSEAVVNHLEAFRTEVLHQPGVQQVSASSGMPGQFFSQQMFQPEGTTEKERLLMPVLSVDYDFLSTMGIEMAQGRGFSRAFATDSSAFILNEAAARKLGWKQPVGKLMEWWQPAGQNDYLLAKHGNVIGIVKDFHFASLHQAIEPLVIHILPPAFSTLAIRIRPETPTTTMTGLEKLWQRYDNDNPFQYSFLDEDWLALYRSEERMGQVFGYFSALGIGIACLGLLGLALFVAELRTREIGIRKVLGAKVVDIVVLLSKNFLQPVLLANVIAWPLAYYAMNHWLENFAYRITISWWVFVVAGATALLIALLTISYQAIRAALANPVKALRTE